MASRRKVLKLIGGGLVLSATGLSGCSVINGPSQVARAAWYHAGQETEFRRRALSYALLAPNPHNRQPWLVKLEGDTALTLYCDLERRLPATDPYDRQTTIGCGAFLELLKIAAAQDGYSTKIVPFPAGGDMRALDSRPIAHVEFTKVATAPDPLFAQILHRRSNKDEYLPQAIPEATLSSLVTQGNILGVNANSSKDAEIASQLRDITWRAYVKEASTSKAYQESVDLMRIGSDEVAANPDGIEMDGRLFSILNLAGLITRETLADPTSSTFKQGLEMYQKKIDSTQAFIWLTNNGENRLDEINAGRAYLRLNLKAAELSLGIHPLSQPLQEYPEMEALYQKTHKLIGEGKRIQMLARVGYAPSAIPTPRWGLSKHLE